jgi:hypothetical protein
MKNCSKCKEVKSYEFFNKHKSYKDGYQTTCKKCINEVSKKYNLQNKERLDKYRNEYYKEYFKNKRNNDNLFKLTSNIRCLIYISIKKQGYTKKTKTHKILGCSFKEFKQHLEKQFTKGMNWDNIGEWHLDHIYPVSLAKTEEEIIKLNHYTNFQPMWAKENISKGNKIIEKQLILL